MAIAVYADDHEFEVMHHGLPRSEDRATIRERLERTAHTFGLVGSDLYQRAVDRFESFDFDRLERKVDAFKRRVNHMFDKDTIRSMSNIGEFQQAGPVQARWIMANPRAKRLYEKEMIKGYEEYKWDRHTGRYGDDDPDYQQVMNGLAVFDEEGNYKTVEYLHLYDDDGRTELTFSQQTTIRRDLWKNFESFLDEGADDPSCSENSSL